MLFSCIFFDCVVYLDAFKLAQGHFAIPAYSAGLPMHTPLLEGQVQPPVCVHSVLPGDGPLLRMAYGHYFEDQWKFARALPEGPLSQCPTQGFVH